MAQTAAQRVDHVIPHRPVHPWALSLPTPLCLPRAAQPRLVTPVLQGVQRVITGHLLGQARLKADEADSGAVTLIQGSGSAADLGIHRHGLVLGGVYPSDKDVKQTLCADIDGSSLHAAVRRGDDDRQALEQSCRKSLKRPKQSPPSARRTARATDQCA